MQTATTDPARPTSRAHTVWIGVGERCLSFHAVPGFEKHAFESLREMWDYIKACHFDNYRVQ